jgi:hypothetical protein
MPDADDRTRIAWHEAGHAAVAIAFGIPVEAVSLRPGEGHRAVTLLGDRPVRQSVEADIIVTVAGAIAADRLELLTGYVEPDSDKVAAAEAALSLERLAPSALALLVEAEGAPADEGNHDDVRAFNRAMSGEGPGGFGTYDQLIAATRLSYLRLVATQVVDYHMNAIRAVATAAYRQTVVPGPQVEALVKASRCLCHREWGPPRAVAA